MSVKAAEMISNGGELTRTSCPAGIDNAETIHGLNNALMTIHGFAGFLEEDLAGNSQLLMYVKKILEAADEATRLLQDIREQQEQSARLKHTMLQAC